MPWLLANDTVCLCNYNSGCLCSAQGHRAVYHLQIEKKHSICQWGRLSSTRLTGTFCIVLHIVLKPQNQFKYRIFHRREKTSEYLWGASN